MGGLGPSHADNRNYDRRDGVPQGYEKHRHKQSKCAQPERIGLLLTFQLKFAILSAFRNVVHGPKPPMTYVDIG